MKLLFNAASLDYSAASVMEFAKEGIPAFWSEPVFHFFPELNREHFFTLKDCQRQAYLVKAFAKYLKDHKVDLDEKAISYQTHWDKNEKQIIEALEDAFEIKLSESFNDLVCLVTMNPISPRYLDRNTFDTFFLQSEKGALGNSIHEIIHFLWFDVWNKQFRDDASEYESPHLKWILSEMVVDTIMRDPRLSSINPYCTHGGCVYPYFYSMKIDGALILETLYDMYKNSTIQDFMKNAFDYCMRHEKEIREHIAVNESQL